MKCKKDHTCAREGCDNKFTSCGKSGSNRKYCCEHCRVHVYLGKPQVDGPLTKKYTEKTNCLNCGESFLKAGYTSKYCSHQCGWDYRHAEEKKAKGLKTEKAKCSECDTVFERKSSPKILNSRTPQLKLTCSPKCSKIRNRRKRIEARGKRIQIPRTCRHCQTKFTFEGYEKATYSDDYKMYCSPDCMNENCKPKYYPPQKRNRDNKRRNDAANKAWADLTDCYVRQAIMQDYKRDGLIMSIKEISPQQIEDRRLLLQAKRAWKQATGMNFGFKLVH